jgi:hypothetical protein
MTSGAGHKRKKVLKVELSNSRALSHCTLQMVHPNCVDT